MHECALADAARPPRASVLQLNLLDYTLGHDLLLWSQRSPFVTYTRESCAELPLAEQINALIKAADVCSQTWEQNNFAPRTFFERRRFKKAWRQWNKCLDHADYPVEIEHFHDYLATAREDLPTVPMPRAKGQEFHYYGAPETARLLNYVSSHHSSLIAHHYRSPYNFPYRLARVLCLTQLETDGAVWIQNYFDHQQTERAKQYAEKNPGSTFAKGPEEVQAAAEKWNREHPESPVALPRRPSTINQEPSTSSEDAAP